MFHDRPTLSDSSFSSSQTKSDEPKMQTMKKNHEQGPANQGEDDCSMLGLEPKCRWRNRETELVQNPQSSNRPVCDFNFQISIFVLLAC